MARNVSFFAIFITCTLLSIPALGASAGADLRVDPEQIEQHIMELSAFGRNPEGGVSRVAFSQADLDGREYISGLMAQAGLQVTVDAAGNLIGFREGSENLPPIMLGSHIDSVPGGGNYDGDVGVIGAIEAARVLHDNGLILRHPLEVVVFTDEEGGLTGSRAMSGQLGTEALQEVSHSGLTIGEGIRRIGGDPSRLAEAKRSPGDITAYLELHIEQGAVLDDAGLDIGIVTGIVGIKWWDVIITGTANHAGTTPMDKRHDALLAAAELIQAVNRVIRQTPGNQVGTVGRIEAEPGAPNVIPGRVVMSLEIRDLSSEVIDSMYRHIAREAATISEKAGVSISFRPIPFDAVPAPTDDRVRRLIGEAVERLGLSGREMPSGAGHDAQDIARIAPIGMIFVPSVGGVSHSPKEFTKPGDMANGANVLLQALLSIDADGLGQ